jgi:predicted dehydrogenase
MIKTAVVGLGKMGLSHLAIARAHPAVELVAGCDASSFLTGGLEKYTQLKCYNDYDRLLDAEQLDAVIIATPSKYHAEMIDKALRRNLHVFCEKPFVLEASEGERLADLAESLGLINQVGYHYRFVSAFQKAAEIVASGALGRIHHVRAEAYGPVVLRESNKTWRSARSEGGGALYDYACHAIDLVHYIHEPPSSVGGVVRNQVFSGSVDDEVYCGLNFRDGSCGQLAVNWSDESHRKMSTKISVWGTNGKVIADRQECQVFLRQPDPGMPGLRAGWKVFYTTELTEDVWFYLRGEEYSAQINHFVECIERCRPNVVNTFRSALKTDLVVQMILDEADASQHSDHVARRTSNGVVRADGKHRKRKLPGWQRIFNS